MLRRSRFRRKRTFATASFALALAAVALAVWIGLVAVERHRGFVAPVWEPDGRHVCLIQRDTLGVVCGFGWEFFSPPADAYVISDRSSLRRLDSVAGTLELLERCDGSPVEERVTEHYRGRIFNAISAAIEPGDGRVAFRITMAVPTAPASELQSLKGVWAPGKPSGAAWRSEWPGSTAAPDDVLVNGVERMVVPGREPFPAAILAVTAEGGSRVPLKNDDFEA